MEGKMEFSKESLNKFESEVRLPSAGKKLIDNYPFLDRLIEGERELLAMRQQGLTPKSVEYRVIQRNLNAIRKSAKALDEHYAYRAKVPDTVAADFEIFYKKFLAEEADGISFASTTPLRAALHGDESRVDKIVSPDHLADSIFDDLGILTDSFNGPRGMKESRVTPLIGPFDATI